jgi:acylphosphatase
MAKHLKIEGLVQGVGYRVSFANRATALGLAGWVRNCRDGTVEACVDGDAEAIEAVIAWAKQGPIGARVSRVVVDEASTSIPAPGEFKILPTQ